MSKREWIEAAKRLAVNWPNQQAPANSLAKWYDDLADLPAAHVTAAVESLYRAGREFCPNGAQIRAEVVRQTLDVPEWGAVWFALCGAVSRYPFDAQSEANEWLATEHLLVGKLARQIDWREFRFSEDSMTTKEAQTREKWKALVARTHHEGTLTGIASGGLAELERVNQGPRLIGEAMKQISEGAA